MGWRPLQAEALLDVGRLEYYLGDYAQAEKTLRRSLLAGQAGRSDPVAADAAQMLAFVVGTRLARPGEALTAVDEGFALLERLGEDPLRSARLLRTAARLHADTGQRAQAIEELQRAIALLDASAGSQARELGNSHLELANLLRLDGQFAQAHEHLTKAQELWSAQLGPEHPSLGLVSMHLGNLLSDEGRLSEAAAAYEAARANVERAYGAEHALFGDACFNLALLHESQGAFSKALAWSERALAVYQKALGPKHPTVGKAFDERCSVNAELGRYAEAVADCQQSLDLLAGSGVDAASPHRSLATTLSLQGQHAAALEQAQQALALSEKGLGPRDLRTARSLRMVASSLGRLGRCKEALVAHARVAELLSGDAPAPERAEALQAYGETELECGAPAKAVERLEQALAIRSAGEGRADLRAQTRLALAKALWDSSGDRARARQLARQAREDFTSLEGAQVAARAAEASTWLDRHR